MLHPDGTVSLSKSGGKTGRVQFTGVKVVFYGVILKHVASVNCVIHTYVSMDIYNLDLEI